MSSTRPNENPVVQAAPVSLREKNLSRLENAVLSVVENVTHLQYTSARLLNSLYFSVDLLQTAKLAYTAFIQKQKHLPLNEVLKKAGLEEGCTAAQIQACIDEFKKLPSFTTDDEKRSLRDKLKPCMPILEELLALKQREEGVANNFDYYKANQEAANEFKLVGMALGHIRPISASSALKGLFQGLQDQYEKAKAVHTVLKLKDKILGKTASDDDIEACKSLIKTQLDLVKPDDAQFKEACLASEDDQRFSNHVKKMVKEAHKPFQSKFKVLRDFSIPEYEQLKADLEKILLSFPLQSAPAQSESSDFVDLEGFFSRSASAANAAPVQPAEEKTGQKISFREKLGQGVRKAKDAFVEGRLAGKSAAPVRSSEQTEKLVVVDSVLGRLEKLKGLMASDDSASALRTRVEVLENIIKSLKGSVDRFALQTQVSGFCSDEVASEFQAWSANRMKKFEDGLAVCARKIAPQSGEVKATKVRVKAVKTQESVASEEARKPFKTWELSVAETPVNESDLEQSKSVAQEEAPSSVEAVAESLTVSNTNESTVVAEQLSLSVEPAPVVDAVNEAPVAAPAEVSPVEPESTFLRRAKETAGNALNSVGDAVSNVLGRFRTQGQNSIVEASQSTDVPVAVAVASVADEAASSAAIEAAEAAAAQAQAEKAKRAKENEEFRIFSDLENLFALYKEHVEYVCSFTDPEVRKDLKKFKWIDLENLAQREEFFQYMIEATTKVWQFSFDATQGMIFKYLKELSRTQSTITKDSYASAYSWKKKLMEFEVSHHEMTQSHHYEYEALAALERKAANQMEEAKQEQPENVAAPPAAEEKAMQFGPQAPLRVFQYSEPREVSFVSTSDEIAKVVYREMVELGKKDGNVCEELQNLFAKNGNCRHKAVSLYLQQVIKDRGLDAVGGSNFMKALNQKIDAAQGEDAKALSYWNHGKAKGFWSCFSRLNFAGEKIRRSLGDVYLLLATLANQELAGFVPRKVSDQTESAAQDSPRNATVLLSAAVTNASYRQAVEERKELLSVKSTAWFGDKIYKEARRQAKQHLSILTPPAA